MTPEVIQNYKSAFAECLTSISEEVIPQILTHLEKVPDDPVEIRSAFGGFKSLPAHWITLLRFMRFATILSTELKINYDRLMSSYQKLNAMASRNQDENRLLGEAGDFLYAVDEISGDLDRLLPRLMRQIRTGMIETYGIVLSPEERIYSDRIPASEFSRMSSSVEELTVICQKMLEQTRVMLALSRIEKLILG